MRIVQVRGVVIVAEINRVVVSCGELVTEPYQDRNVVKVQDRWTRIDTVIAPDIGGRNIRMKLMERRLQVEIIVHVRQELVPPLMVGARCFTACSVGTQRGRRTQ